MAIVLRRGPRAGPVAGTVAGQLVGQLERGGTDRRPLALPHQHPITAERAAGSATRGPHRATTLAAPKKSEPTATTIGDHHGLVGAKARPACGSRPLAGKQKTTTTNRMKRRVPATGGQAVCAFGSRCHGGAVVKPAKPADNAASERIPAPGGKTNPGPWRESESRPLAGSSKRFGRLARVAKEWTTRFHSYPAPQHRGSPSIAQSFMPPTVRRQPESLSAWHSGLSVCRPVSLAVRTVSLTVRQPVSLTVRRQSAWQSGLSVWRTVSLSAGQSVSLSAWLFGPPV